MVSCIAALVTKCRAKRDSAGNAFDLEASSRSGLVKDKVPSSNAGARAAQPNR
jgi:hypothetical protein